MTDKIIQFPEPGVPRTPEDEAFLSAYEAKLQEIVNAVDA